MAINEWSKFAAFSIQTLFISNFWLGYWDILCSRIYHFDFHRHPSCSVIYWLSTDSIQITIRQCKWQINDFVWSTSLWQCPLCLSALPYYLINFYLGFVYVFIVFLVHLFNCTFWAMLFTSAMLSSFTWLCSKVKQIGRSVTPRAGHSPS